MKFPGEITRTPRSINFRSYYKANEFKNTLFYIVIYALKEFQDTKYYEHLLKYILFIRLLTDDIITDDSIIVASQLINDFSSQFSNLYDRENETFNLHAHLHLPLQVYNYGPLNKINLFAFEGEFFIFSDLYHGVRGVGEQIARNLHMRRFYYFQMINKNINNINKGSYLG